MCDLVQCSAGPDVHVHVECSCACGGVVLFYKSDDFGYGGDGEIGVDASVLGDDDCYETDFLDADSDQEDQLFLMPRRVTGTDL